MADKLNQSEFSEALTASAVLHEALSEDRPIVAILGQSLHLNDDGTDPTCLAALEHLGIEGSSWTDIFVAGALKSEFYQWLNERFERRAPARELVAIADGHFSAVFTSSFDPVLRTLFATDGRQPEPVLVGDPPPPISRSKLKPRIHYLFGMTGAGQFEPPTTKLALKTRHARHATPMLNTVFDVATPLGIVVIDGFVAGGDWLEPGSILGHLSSAAAGSVLWFGPDPKFEPADAELFDELLRMGVVLRDQRSLALALAEVAASAGKAKLRTWNEPGIISFEDGKRLVTTPSIRLSTEASASIVDDSWMDILQPLGPDADRENFAVFHSIPSSIRLLIDGVRRNYAIRRDFETDLLKIVRAALGNHANEKGAIVVSGQSGIGKSVALYRLATSVREERTAAVLFARDRIPLAAELGGFLSEVDKLNKVTLLLVDALAAPKRYDTLLESFRSRGHRIVIVGTSYGSDLTAHRHDGRLISVAPTLHEGERKKLAALAREHLQDQHIGDRVSGSDHALAHFFWTLPQSRSRLALGLGREARVTERGLRDKGRSRRTVQFAGTLALKLMEAGYRSEAPLLQQVEVDNEQEGAAAKLVDYIMSCSRVHRWVPVNLILRAVVSGELTHQAGTSSSLIRDLFEGHDLFRWRYHDNSEDQLLVGARLQLEAQLICDQRLGGPVHEARKILELVLNASRAGPDESEETRFVAEIVYALGPDGPLGERYYESYGEIAETLTILRKDRGVKNARLMLQEATLRRAFIRKNEQQISDDERIRLLDGAREAVEEALSEVARPSGGLRAARRTVQNLWVERAATYGYLATSAARRGEPSDIVWASYLAAREAVRKAAGKVDSYHPLDISLWTPLGILESSKDLGIEREVELKADIVAAIDMVQDDELDSGEAEFFQRQRLRAGEIVGDMDLSDDAFETLDRIGSSVGYFYRAKKLSPVRSDTDSLPNRSDIRAAQTAANYLLDHRDRILDDARSIRLLLQNLWLAKTGTWLFRGLRQPLPASESDRRIIRDALTDLAHASGGDFPPKYRYLTAVLAWLTGDESRAVGQFRELGRDTEYVEAKRVLPRHVITDPEGKTVAFSGVAERKIGDQRWSIHVRELNRKVDLLEGRWIRDISIGREIVGFAIAFNYLGPIAVRPEQ